MAKFTSGPWHLGWRRSVWRKPFEDNQGRRIHQPICDAGCPAALSDEEKTANANLIAAAPEMYEALANMCADAENAVNPSSRLFGYKEAKAALAKADGTENGE